MIRTAVLAAAIALSLTTTAAADRPAEGGPSQEQLDQAQEHYAKGKAHHDAGEYDQAAAEYAKSYELSKLPVLLYNMAQVERLGGHAEQALEHYKQYLEVDPNGPGAERAREFVDAITTELEQAAKEGKEPKVVEKDEGSDPDQAKPIEPPANPNPVIMIPPPVDRPESSRGRVKKITGIVVGSAGLIGIGLGVKFGLDARSKQDEVAELAGVWDPSDEAIWDDGESAERSSIILLSVGTAAVAGGVVLYMLGSRDAKAAESRVTAAPIAGRDSLGVALSGRF